MDLEDIKAVCCKLKVFISKWEGSSDCSPDIGQMSDAESALSLLRNSFAQCPRLQNLVAEDKDCLDSVVHCMSWTFNSNKVENIKLTVDMSLWNEEHDRLATSCVTCLANMMVANSTTRHILWPHLQMHLLNLLGYRSKTVSHLSCAVLHHFLLEADIREEILRSEYLSQLIITLLELYSFESQHSCFVLFCLEFLLCGRDVVSSTWPVLLVKQSLLCVDILSSVVQHSPHQRHHSLPAQSLIFLSDYYKNEADKILCTYDKQVKDCESVVIASLLTFLCTAAASEAFQQLLQKDKSLIISSVYLLRAITDIGEQKNNSFTPLNTVADTKGQAAEEAHQHPAFGFKCNLIRLIASLVYRNKANQDEVREIDGIPLLLSSSQYDVRNPFIKETVIYCLRNLLEGNVDNQAVIKQLQMQGVAENPSLLELGLEAKVEGEKLSLYQKT